MNWQLTECMQYIFRKPFGIHSPFLYNFADQCLFADDHHQRFDQIEQNRRKLTPVTSPAPGPKASRLLYRTAIYFNAPSIIEINVRQQLTRQYFQLAGSSISVHTVDQNSIDMHIGQGEFRGIIYLDNEMHADELSRLYPLLFDKVYHESLIIYYGINKNRETKKLWKTMAADQRITLALELGKLGYLFFNKALSKEIIRVGF